MKHLPRLLVPVARSLRAFALLFLAAITSVLAQPATGSIEGRVVNRRSGEFLERARITVEGTALETFTDSDGNYRFASVPPGKMKLHIFYTGLLPQADEVAVVAGQTTKHDVNLLTFENRPGTAKEGEIVK